MGTRSYQACGFLVRFDRFAIVAALGVLFALAVSITPALAQDSGETLVCPITMDEAITLEREQIEELFSARMIEYEVADTLAINLQQRVKSYLEPHQNPADDRARGLLFFIGNTQTLCVMFWRIGSEPADSLFIVEKLAVPPSALVPVIDGMVLDMQNAPANTLRAAIPSEPKNRGASALARRPSRSASNVLSDLSALLFPGAIAENVSDLASLTILPCLNIGIVPFAALDPDGDGRPFVETTVINIEAEMRHVYENRGFSWNGTPSEAVVFGDPATSDPHLNFPRLPGAAREATLIGGTFGVPVVLGEDATRRSVIGSIPTADYIHIAAHGISSVEEPLDDSFLALSDGRLTAREILHVDLQNAPLVVLSACQTGLGGPLDAGIIGLARSFVLAGASGAVATLWNVDDAATAEIMLDFASNLDTMSPPEALRLAQQRARERFGHPRYWSGFMIFGSRMVTI